MGVLGWGMSDGARGGRVPVLTRAGDALERVVFGRYEAWYRRFVKLVWVVVAALAVVHVARYLGIDLGLSPDTAATLDWVTSIAVTVFLVTGALQLVLVARGVQRRRAAVAASAAALEDSAAAVETAADEVEAAAAETPAPERAVERAASARETAEIVEETVDEVRAELEPDDDEKQDDEERDGAGGQ